MTTGAHHWTGPELLTAVVGLATALISTLTYLKVGPPKPEGLAVVLVLAVGLTSMWLTQRGIAPKLTLFTVSFLTTVALVATFVAYRTGSSVPALPLDAGTLNWGMETLHRYHQPLLRFLELDDLARRSASTSASLAPFAQRKYA